MLASSPAPQRKVRKGNGGGNSSGQHIKVFVRVRPMNEGEKISKSCSLVHCPNNKEIVVQERPLDKHTKKFTFDKVFDAKSKQVDIYKSVAKPLVEEVLNGFNCTIFAYGQTGTGKTYTMEGDHYHGTATQDENVSGAGIIPRCVNQLFDELRIQKLEFTMRVSFLELYNEEVFDLLSAHDDLSKLRLYEDTSRKGSCIIQGLEEVLVRSKTDVYNIIEKGSSKRQTAATLMNAHSSRSHTVFTVTVHIKENTLDGDELLKTGKLHLVDLAGSENIGRSGAVDKRAREAGNINQSLLTLGRVITSLVEKAPHIPYRESKLTRLLQDALGGRTKTSIIATISPASVNLEETLSTLDYAHRAKNIQNRPEVNQKLNKKELIGEYTNEIEKLRRDLLAMREKNGVYLANENYQEILSTMEQQAQEISEKISEIRTLEGELEKQLELFKETTEELNVVNEKLNDTESKFLKTKEVLQCTQALLSQTATERDEQKHLVSAHCKTESSLHTQGKTLIKVAETTISDVTKLQDKLDRKRKVETLNEEAEKSFEKRFEERVSAMHSSIQAFHKYHHKSSSAIFNAICDTKTTCTTNMNSLVSSLEQMNLAMLSSLHNCDSFFERNVNESSENGSQFVDSLTEKTETENKTVACFMDSVFLPLVSQMNELFLTHNNSMLGLKENIREGVNQINTLCQIDQKEKSSLLQLMEDRLSELTKYPSLILQEMNIKSDHFEKTYKSHTRKFKDITCQLSALLGEHEKFLTSQVPLLPQIQQNQINIMEKSSKQVLEDVKQLSEISSKHAEQSLQTGEEIVSSLLAKIEKIEDTNHQSEQVMRSISTKVDKKVTGMQAFIQQVFSSAEEYKDDASKHCAAGKQEFKKQIKDSADEISSLNNGSSADVLNLIDRTENNISDIEEKLLRSESELEEFLADHNDQLKESGESVQAFTKQLVKDLPTGTTPMRKEYSYPSTLAATSPHESLINRFRIRANLGSKIPLPQFNHDSEDDLNSPPLPPSSGTSCNSSLISENDNTSSTNEFLHPLSRNGSFKDKNEFAYPSHPPPPLKISISRSSSSSSLTDVKENVNTNSRRTASSKKGEIKPPSSSITTAVSTEKLASEAPASRARKVLGPFN